MLSCARVLNVELAEKSIGVTAVRHGWMETEFFGVAQKNADAKTGGNFMCMSKPESVVAQALRDGKKHRDMSVYGITNKLHLFF